MRQLILTVCSALVVGCSAMSDKVGQFSTDYGSAMEQFSNNQIVSNVLRAKDKKPLQFSELGQVNGALMEQFQFGATVPFGENFTLNKSVNQFQPQLQFSSSPTFTTSPLDTEAFTVGLLQPIDATYLVDRWKDADSNAQKELLLRLFIDSIDNVELLASIDDLKGTIRNTPNNEAFSKIVQSLIENGSEFRSVTVLSPLGPDFEMCAIAPADHYKVTDIASTADEVNVHLAKVQAGSGGCNTYRLYRRWDNQLAICIPEAAGPAAALPIAPTGSPTSQPPAPLGQEAKSAVFNFTTPIQRPWLMIAQSSGKGGQGSGGGQPPSKQGGGQGAGSPGLIASPVMPLIGVLSLSECLKPKLVDDTPLTEDAIKNAKTLQIRLRSVAGVFSYLGRTTPLKSTVESGKILFQVLLDASTVDPESIKIRGTYDGNQAFFVATSQTDLSMDTVVMLNQLVNWLKLSSDIATTKQVQVIP
jgi:hypothetical protein